MKHYRYIRYRKNWISIQVAYVYAIGIFCSGFVPSTNNMKIRKSYENLLEGHQKTEKARNFEKQHKILPFSKTNVLSCIFFFISMFHSRKSFRGRFQYLAKICLKCTAKTRKTREFSKSRFGTNPASRLRMYENYVIFSWLTSRISNLFTSYYVGLLLFREYVCKDFK